MEAEDSIEISPLPAEAVRPEFPYMKNIIRISKTVNMWPNTNNTNSFRYHFVIFIIIVISLLNVICSSIKAQTEYTNLDSAASLVAPVIGTIAAIFRYVYVYVRGDDHLLLVSEIHNNFIHYSLFPKENKQSILKYYKLANKLVWIYSIFTLLWMFQLCGIPLFVFILNFFRSDLDETELSLIPYPVSMKVYAPFDYNKQPANALFYFYQFIVFMTIVWVYVLADCFWYMVIFLTIGQFALLTDSVNTISENLQEKDQYGGELFRKSEIQNVESGLKHCIRHHQFLRRFIRQMDNLSSPVLLVDTLQTVISMCFVLLDVTAAVHLRDWHRLLHSVEYIMSVTVHVFTYNWLGNELALKEEELAEAVYNIPWSKCPKIKPLLMGVMMQARRPFKLTGGKMFTLSLELFTTMMQAGFSYFMFFLEFSSHEPAN